MLWRGAKRGQAALGDVQQPAVMSCWRKSCPGWAQGGAGPVPGGCGCPVPVLSPPALLAGALFCVFPRPWAVTHGFGEITAARALLDEATGLFLERPGRF